LFPGNAKKKYTVLGILSSMLSLFLFLPMAMHQRRTVLFLALVIAPLASAFLLPGAIWFRGLTKAGAKFALPL
jgi:hypothetical protein